MRKLEYTYIDLHLPLDILEPDGQSQMPFLQVLHNLSAGYLDLPEGITVERTVERLRDFTELLTGMLEPEEGSSQQYVAEYLPPPRRKNPNFPGSVLVYKKEDEGKENIPFIKFGEAYKRVLVSYGTLSRTDKKRSYEADIEIDTYQRGDLPPLDRARVKVRLSNFDSPLEYAVHKTTTVTDLVPPIPSQRADALHMRCVSFIDTVKEFGE